MTGPNDRWAILTILCFLLSMQVSAQSTDPTLVNTMNSIANALNSRGTISWTETLPEIFGASYTVTSSLSEVNADSSACSLRWKSVYTSSDDKLAESFLVRFEIVSSARVQALSEYRKSEAVQKIEVAPEIYVVEMKTDAPLAKHRELYHKNKLKKETKPPSDHEARIAFTDEQAANRVVDGIRQATKSCKASK